MVEDTNKSKDSCMVAGRRRREVRVTVVGVGT